MLLAVLLCMMIMFGWQWYMSKRFGPEQSQPEPTSQQQQQQQQQTTVPTAVTTGDGTPVAVQPSLMAPAAGTWKLLTLPKQQEKQAPVVFGDLEKRKGGYKAQITLDPGSASVRDVLLSEYKLNITDEHTGYPLLVPARDDQDRVRYSLMSGVLKIAGRAEVFDLSGNCWKMTASVLAPTSDNPVQSVSFTATIVNQNGQPILDVVKTYSYGPDNYNLDFSFRLINKTFEPLLVESLEFFGPLGLRREDPRSDRRNAVVLYLDRERQPQVVRELLMKIQSDPEKGQLEKPTGATLQWLAVSNKFFAATLGPKPTGAKQKTDWLDRSPVTAAILNATEEKAGKIIPVETIVVQTRLQWEKPIEARSDLAYNFQVYLGPIDKEVFDECCVGLDYENLIYRPSCSFCSFNGLTYLIFKLMKGIYGIVGNYGVAIIILVLMVRLALHPISKKSQVNMMKMQKLSPKIEEVKQKYAGNKEEIQKRTMEVYKDQGMAGNMILGCLPMLLQLPIWIALFTAVDANIALRHQGLLPASWHWLNDLSAPDRLIPLSVFGINEAVQIPLVGGVDAFNLLPILLCIGMFLQTKFSPQSRMSSAANPQAAQQQKMMLYMMPVMMLVFFYTAPSGLNLYIMSSTFGGLIEQHFIRKHLKEEQDRAEVGIVPATTRISGRMGPKKKKPKPPFKYM